VSEWVVIGFVFATGVASAFSAPASQTLIVQLVEEPDVPQAVALNSTTYNLARRSAPRAPPLRSRGSGSRLRSCSTRSRTCCSSALLFVTLARAGARRVAVAPGASRSSGAILGWRCSC
jgi:hypothetical protein